MKEEIKSFALLCLIVAGSAAGTLAIIIPRNLPQPPDLTAAEMATRLESYCTSHLENCAVCQKEMTFPNLRPPQCYLDAYKRGLTVGSWRALSLANGGYLWQYIGRPVAGWRWSVLTQGWQLDRRTLK